MNIPETRGRARKYKELYDLKIGDNARYPENMTKRVRPVISRIQQECEKKFATRVIDGEVVVWRTA